MKSAKLFQNGQSQAVRLPKEFRFPGRSVFIQRVGDYVVLIPEEGPWQSMVEAAGRFTPDFMADREQGEQQDRDGFDD